MVLTLLEGLYVLGVGIFSNYALALHMKNSKKFVA